MPADSAKQLLVRYSQRRYAQFVVSDEQELTLPSVSPVPWIGTAKRADFYKKSTQKYGNGQVNFISKNNHAFSFQWQTNPATLKKAVRWGIVKTESITGKVISALGNYRIHAHQTIAKGLISNTYLLKIKLCDHYQDRFEALQQMESLTNLKNTKKDYQEVFESYINRLTKIQSDLHNDFRTTLTEIQPDVILQLQEDIEDDIRRAQRYYQALQENAEDEVLAPQATNRARGKDSILEFVKQQMLHGLYEMQGINQDFSYSKRRKFALTRGTLNDCIEEARKEIEDHQVDPRNATQADHHGLYFSENGVLTYDFAQDQLSPSRQREVLLAISFIENWDHVDISDPSSPLVKNIHGSERLTIINATNWQLHRNFKVFLKSIGYFLLNMIKGMFISTRPWAEETWGNKDFLLLASSLREQASPNDPLILKPIRFLKNIVNFVKDCFQGIRNVGSRLVIQMPRELFNDWESSCTALDCAATISQANYEITVLQAEESKRLSDLIAQIEQGAQSVNFQKEQISTSPHYEKAVSRLVKVDYHLTSGEQNDILTAFARGLDSFSSVFTGNIYAKDPIAGLIFTAAYAIGGAAIFFPEFSTQILGTGYVNWFSNVAYSMGSSKLAATIGAGSTQAQIFATTWDTLIQGGNGLASNFITQIAEDPLTYGSYFAFAYGLGYFLVNGINGYAVPGLSEVLKEDLGTTPEASYALIGAKFAIGGYELFYHHTVEGYEPLKIKYNGNEIKEYTDDYPGYQRIINQYRLAFWLSTHAPVLPKLKPTILYKIERQIDNMFDAEEAASMKKILYPEQDPSIAFQLFSIPLSYIPAILRVLIALLVTTPYAWLQGNPHCLEPIRNAGKALFQHIKKDLSRVLTATTLLGYVFHNVLLAIPKALTFAIILCVGRLTGLTNSSFGHTIYRILATIHTQTRAFIEAIYPFKAIKSVVSASPSHTIRQMEQSYIRVLENLKIVSSPIRAVEKNSNCRELSTISKPLFLKDSMEVEIISPCKKARFS